MSNFPDEFYCLVVGNEFVANSSVKKNYHIDFSYRFCKAKKFHTLRTALAWYGFVNQFCSPDLPLYLKRYYRFDLDFLYSCIETIDVSFYV